MKPDIKKYRKYVDHFDITEEHKIELIHILWNFMENFVDRAFGNDSVQTCLEIKAKKIGQDSPNMLDSKQSK
ncbi:MAG: hypothetical protein HRU28_07545 [Rhizobiales bacterium]|nr:hypothetical protein [Hyphomicrobiales bacterium]